MGNNANKAALATRNLTDKEIEMIMVNTNLSKEDVLKWHNQFLTEFKDGFINKKEFIDIYKNTYSTGNAQKFALFAFKAFDEDQNGKITFPGKAKIIFIYQVLILHIFKIINKEFILSTSFLMKKNSPREDEQKRLELAFDIFDVRRIKKSAEIFFFNL